MLDFNESAINKKFKIIPDNGPSEPTVPWFPKDIRKNLSKPCKKVEPYPGACIKTWTENGDKVFINVCHSKALCPPEDITDEQLHKIMMDEDPNFVIPMAVGFEKMAKIKDGSEKATFDILINTSYFEKCMNKPFFWKFTIAVIIGSLNDKYNKFIDTSKYVILKNCKVMGSLDTFTIEDREPRKSGIKKPLIEELTEKKNEEIESQIKLYYEENLKHQHYIIIKSNDGKNLLGFFYLPSSSITNISSEVSESRIIVENKETNHVMDVFVPYFIDNGNTIACYDSKLHVLRLILPLKNSGLR